MINLKFIFSLQQVEFTADDLRDLGEIGRGGFGTVNKMVHRKTNTIMAVKVSFICYKNV